MLHEMGDSDNLPLLQQYRKLVSVHKKGINLSDNSIQEIYAKK